MVVVTPSHIVDYVHQTELSKSMLLQEREEEEEERRGE